MRTESLRFASRLALVRVLTAERRLGAPATA
jgi:hypothetical protein